MTNDALAFAVERAAYQRREREAAARIEQLEEELSIWKSVFPDIAPERVLPDRSLLNARIEQLEADNASLSTWQCVFTDGKTGLVCGEHGDTYCAMAKRVEQLEAVLRTIKNGGEIMQPDGSTEVVDLENVAKIAAAALESKP